MLFDVATGRAKVADFGLSRLTPEEPETPETAAAPSASSQPAGGEASGEGKRHAGDAADYVVRMDEHTMSFEKGSLMWMAPEVMCRVRKFCAKYGKAVDVYSFGE